MCRGYCANPLELLNKSNNKSVRPYPLNFVIQSVSFKINPSNRAGDMAGIYLHIPFCRQACHYCNFHFSTSLNRKNDFVTALLKEMERRKEYIGARAGRKRIYFGGDAPSLLDPGELNAIMEGLQK